MAVIGPKNTVYLVGAGPGDPGLITVRGMELLRKADVVVYDALANPALLNHCLEAKTIYAGKRANQHAMKQPEITSLLVELGQKHRCVVRLKGGDPFVFGRGGEEAEALAEAGIAFEIVPGITAAVAAAAYAGIPVTHRDFNSSFTLITGHEKELSADAAPSPILRGSLAGSSADNAQAADPAKAADVGLSADVGETTPIDWTAIARLPCIAFYMGIKTLPSTVQKLMDHGMAANTPAATIQWGTTPKQRVVTAPLAALPQAVADANIGAPAITIIGRVVSMRSTLQWFENRPLFGQRILVTRTRQQASELSEKLTALGAEVLEAPTIALATPENEEDVRQAIRTAKTYDWIIFTSVNGVEATKARLMAFGEDTRTFGNARIAVIGSATAGAIWNFLGRRVDLCPDEFVAEALADALIERGEVPGKRFLLLRADIARPVLREKLIEHKAASVHDVPIYSTVVPRSLPPQVVTALAEKRVDWITFTSSSTASNLATMLGPDYRAQLENVKRASIGPITSATLNSLGLPPTLEASTHTVAGLVDALRDAAAEARRLE